MNNLKVTSKKEFESSGIELSTFCRQLKLGSEDGEEYLTDCVDAEFIFKKKIVVVIRQ